MYPFESQLAASWLPASWQDTSVIAAVSGGADSVGLLRALAAIKQGGAGRLIVAHFDHRLRPESGDQARFVADLAASLGLPFELGAGDVSQTAADVGDGIEAAARSQRYAFLQQTAERLGARYVATAHTADDQAETILHRIVRGTGLAGLGGMRRARPLSAAVTLIRPLLTAFRAAIRDYLAEIGQAYVEDSTNNDLRLTRNRIRHDLLPRLTADYNPETVAALLRLGETARDAQEIIAAEVERMIEAAVTSAASDQVTIDCRRLIGRHRHLVRELFVTIWRDRSWPMQAMGFAEWDALAEMALSTHSPPQRIFPGSIAAQKSADRLTLVHTY